MLVLPCACSLCETVEMMVMTCGLRVFLKKKKIHKWEAKLARSDNADVVIVVTDDIENMCIVDGTLW